MSIDDIVCGDFFADGFIFYNLQYISVNIYV